MYKPRFVIDLFHGDRDRSLSNRSMFHMLNALRNIDADYLRANPRTPLLYRSGIVYREEPAGQDDWQDIPSVRKQGWGDCEDLACWRAAELWVRFGMDAHPFLHWEEENADGNITFHILVRWPNGRIEDPSKRLGMK